MSEFAFEPGQLVRVRVPDGSPLLCSGCGKDFREGQKEADGLVGEVAATREGPFRVTQCPHCKQPFPSEIVTPILVDGGRYGVPTTWLVPVWEEA